MKIHRGKPRQNNKFMFLKKCKSRMSALDKAKKLLKSFNVPYIKKCGKIGDKMPYEIWVRRKSNINNIYKG